MSKESDFADALIEIIKTADLDVPSQAIVMAGMCGMAIKKVLAGDSGEGRLLVTACLQTLAKHAGGTFACIDPSAIAPDAGEAVH